jgi:hypothetical protein
MLGNESVSSVPRDAGLKSQNKGLKAPKFFENLNCCVAGYIRAKQFARS